MDKPVLGVDNSTGFLMKDDKKVCSKGLKIVAISADKGKFLIECGSQRLICTKKEFASPRSFAEAISPASYYLTGVHHEDVKKWLIDEYELTPPCLILEDLTDVCGRFKDEFVDFWIVKDYLIFKDAPPIRFPTSGVLDLQTPNKIYHITLTNVMPGLIPIVDPYQTKFETPLAELLAAWLSVYKCEPLLYSILGYFAACMHMPEIGQSSMKENFPLMGIVGTTAMGKTALLHALYYFWGMSFSPANYPYTSPAVEVTQLCQASCFPIWRDEFRREKYAEPKESYLRSLFDRGPISKGTTEAGKTKNFYPRGTLLLSGEDIIVDPALRRRFVIFQLKETYKLSAKEWRAVDKMAKELFPQLFWHFFSSKWNAEVFEELLQEELISDNTPERELTLYAALGAIAGKEIGLQAIKSASAFWTEIIAGKDQLTVRLNGVETFLEFLQNLLVEKNWYNGTTMGQNRKPAEVRRFIEIKPEEGSRIYFWGLITFAYKNGFREETNLGPQALRSMIYDYLKVKTKSIRIEGRRVQGIEIAAEIQDERLQIILDNVKTAKEDDVAAEAEILNNKLSYQSKKSSW